MKSFRIFVAGAMLISGLALLAPQAHAASLVVRNLNDDGEGSLRAAIAAANADPGADTITFRNGLDGLLALQAPLDIGTDITIIGPGPSGRNAIKLYGRQATSILAIVGSGSTTVSISGLQFLEGYSSDGGGCINMVDADVTLTNVVFKQCHSDSGGGGISAYGFLATGTLTLNDFAMVSNTGNRAGGLWVGNGFEVTVSNGTFSRNLGDAGAVAIDGPESQNFENVLFQANLGMSAGALYDISTGDGTTSFSACTFIANHAQDTGAIYADYTTGGSGGKSMLVTNSTFLFNYGNIGAGAIEVTGGSDASFKILFDTIMYNTSESGTAGGLVAGGPTQVSHSVITENIGYYGEEEDDIDVGYLSVVEFGYSLLGEAEPSDATDPILDTWTSGKIGADPELQLFSVPGQLPMMLPTINSPLINGGAQSFNVAEVETDARGLPRRAGVRYDVGAVEWQAPLKPQNTTAIGAVGAIRVSWEAPTSAGDSAVTGYRVFRKVGNRWVKEATTGATGRSLLIGGLVAGRSYTFFVVAINKAGLGPQSRAVTAVAS